MATQKQIEANRRNARKSTGPVTQEGKAKTRFNSLKHGMTAEVAVLPHEDVYSYQQMCESLVDSYRPVGAGEEMLVQLIAVNYWRLLRARRMETASFSLHLEAIKSKHDVSTRPTLDDDAGIAIALSAPEDNFRNIERYQTTLERAYYRSVEALRKAQNDRRKEELRSQPPLTKAAKNKNGSVPNYWTFKWPKLSATATRSSKANRTPLRSRIIAITTRRAASGTEPRA